MKLFYDEVRAKRKGKRMRLQVDNEFQQIKIKSLNNENNVEMFTSSAFAAEQKIRELKARISKLNAQKLKISPNKIMQNLVLNMIA